MESYEVWLIKAKSDLESSEILYQKEIFDTAIYHTQQCAEKALKAYLAFRKQPIRKVHDLVALIEEAADFDPQFSELFTAAEKLNPYNVEFRYPDETLEPDKNTVQEAISDAKLIFDFVKSKIK